MRRRSALSAALVLALTSLVVPTALAAPSGQAVTTDVAAEAAGTTVSVTFTGNLPTKFSYNNVVWLEPFGPADGRTGSHRIAAIPLGTGPTATVVLSDVVPGTYALSTGRYRSVAGSNIPAGTIGIDGTWTFAETGRENLLEVGREPIVIGPVDLPRGGSFVGTVVDAGGAPFPGPMIEARSADGNHARWDISNPNGRVDGRFTVPALGSGLYTFRLEHGGGFWLVDGANGSELSPIPGEANLRAELDTTTDLGQIVVPDIFADVTARLEHSAAIWWMKLRGYSTGHDDGTYRPFEPVRRDAMAAFLYRAAGSPAFRAPEVSPFTDIRPGDAFYKEMSWLAATRISRGWDDGTFRPHQPVNRDAMAAFLYRWVDHTGSADGSDEDPSTFATPTTSPFTDIVVDTQFYREISWLAAAGITTGYGQDPGRTYQPLKPVWRDAMAAFIFRTVTDPAPDQTVYEPNATPLN